MTNYIPKKVVVKMPGRKKRSKKIIRNTLLATLGGAVVSAGALALSDKKIKNKLTKTVKKLENEGLDKLDEIIENLKKSKKRSKKKLSR
jgi:hypothetical protein